MSEQELTRQQQSVAMLAGALTALAYDLPDERCNSVLEMVNSCAAHAGMELRVELRPTNRELPPRRRTKR